MFPICWEASQLVYSHAFQNSFRFWKVGYPDYRICF